MRLQAITATPHPEGYRVDVAWAYPETPEYPAVRVVRRAGSHPVSPDDGTVVAEGDGLTGVQDIGLEAETTYYYALFPYRGPPREYAVDRRNRVSAMATGAYALAEQMYEYLPALYRRYDAELPDPAQVAPADAERGQLRRFLELPGAQLDQLYSFTRALSQLYDLRRTPGRALPLLAQWIGWPTDTRLELERQRKEIRHAPLLYQRIGIIPVIGATTKRISGWESRTKEFVFNVHRSNEPERLNLWARRGTTTGWSEEGELLSLDHAFDGRPASARQGDTLWLFYQTPRNGRWDIWFKTLDAAGDGDWSPSDRLTNRAVLDKHPVATVADGVLWLFWSGRDPATGRWGLYARRHQAGAWSDIEALGMDRAASVEPAATTAADAVWLFWLERDARLPRLRYDRFDGAAWAGAMDFPFDAGTDPRVEAEPFAVFQGDPVTLRLFVFWTRKRPGGPAGQSRWEIAYRIKTNLDADATGWSNVRVLPAAPADADLHDREPFARVNDTGELELYWSSSREGTGWSLWRSRMTAFDADPVAGADTWSAAERVTDGPYSERTPAVIDAPDTPWLIYRSNRHLTHDSGVYRATTIIDGRYAGSTAVDTRNAAALAQRQAYDDALTYTFNTGRHGRRDNDDWYARDTVGVYLDNDTMDEAAVRQGIDRLRPVMEEFMPLTDRAVFVPRRDWHTDWFYTYERPGDGIHTITEVVSDELNGVVLDSVFNPGEDFLDELE